MNLSRGVKQPGVLPCRLAFYQTVPYLKVWVVGFPALATFPSRATGANQQQTQFATLPHFEPKTLRRFRGATESAKRNMSPKWRVSLFGDRSRVIAPAQLR